MKNLELNSIKDLKKEGKSFYWASFFLSKNTKIKAGTLYSICRYFDNVADKDSENKSKFLKDSFEIIKNDKENVVNKFLNQNNINILIFSDLIKGLIKDQHKVKIQNKNELINYSYYVAGTVGLMMSKIIGVINFKANPTAIDLGIAMQLTNIVRDVHEDAKMNRVYIPAELMPNITLSMLSGEQKIELKQEHVISSAVHKLIDLSEEFYLNGFSGLKYIPFRTRLAIFIAANVYRGISIKIRGKGKKFLKKRIYLNSFEKIIITIKSISILIFIPIFNYKYKNIRDKFQNEDL
ncbi:squalene/phytoene synthase family protein [Pelagibacteraceae bacterium]|nr:squalene/phytoene synthase family protein [Pelagibacteraceae bacterium]